MANCSECEAFFKIPENDLDFEAEKGDCVLQHRDQKGTYWTSKPVFESDSACEQLTPRR